MAVGATNIQDFAIIAGIGVAAGAVGMLALQSIKNVQFQTPPIPRPGVGTAQAMLASADYRAYPSYFWDFRDLGVHPHQNYIYNKLPWIELSSTTEFDPNRMNFVGSYSSCSDCIGERRSPIAPERVTNLR